MVYPPATTQVTARDSNFIFGSVGSGDALLTINGLPVTVAPNGAFLGFLPVPADGVYHLVARAGADSAALDHVVRVPQRMGVPQGPWLDRASIEPRGVRWAEPGELVRVKVRAMPGADAWLVLPNDVRVPLAADPGAATPQYGPFDRQPSRPGEAEAGRYAGAFAAVALDSVNSAWIVVARGTDTLRERVPLHLTMIDPARRPVVILDDDTARTGNTDGAVSGKPLPDGTFEWVFRNGTVAAVSGRAGDHLRLALSPQTSVWVAESDVARTLPAGTPPPYSRVSLVRLTPGDSSVVARVALSQRLPIKVEERDSVLVLRIYNARADLDWLQYGGTDPLVRRMSWAQQGEEVIVTFELSKPVWGYRSRWEGTDFLFEIRRAPAINARAPLRGRVIAIDPGHPPVGATGPTGFMEKDANLAVGLALRQLLERAGARVVMTRSTDTAIGLYERTNMAEAQGAEILVSIHNNAFPDGVNPWANNGTSAYYFQPRAVRLAMLVQDAMVAQMGLPNLGIGRGDLALVRPTWMPAVLCEGAFLMIPEQENALKTPSFQARYARGVMQGIERYLRETLGR